ncbi:hypothetical protein AVEN_225155-1 [Araneus ventricosus]|uniref:Uncharacterized protein n=1 Tax=Araneus ventricosus TaxID=182803 RepID=A0A4Y2FTF0_ARAVE|nr:hypothetical protein AVEN_225155-1 [Araneus ventricosus]
MLIPLSHYPSILIAFPCKHFSIRIICKIIFTAKQPHGIEDSSFEAKQNALLVAMVRETLTSQNHAAGSGGFGRNLRSASTRWHLRSFPYDADNNCVQS